MIPTMHPTPPLLLLLLGCPYIFGGPDLSNVGDGPGPAPTDTTPTTETGPDTATTPPTGDTEPIDTDDTGSPTPTGATAHTGPTVVSGLTGDTGPVGTAPVIEELTLGYRYDGMVIAATLSDVDGDLDGGSVTLTDGKASETYLLPDDVISWDPKTGEARFSYRPSDYCDGIDRSFRVYATDSRGNSGGDAPVSADIFGVGKLVETGSYFTPVGEIEVPAVFCAEADTGYDEDYVQFRVPTPGLYDVTLGWEGAADLDLWLSRNYYTVASSITFSVDPPERLEANLATGDQYVMEVLWYKGDVVDWTAIIEGP